MSQAIYEFPLNEKVRTYLRLEQLFFQLEQGKTALQDWQYINFLSSLFILLDLSERIDLRNDVLKDIEIQEKNLVLWSQHPNIDNDALQSALQQILCLREELKSAKKFGSDLKEDRFLAAIRQRFSIPGGTTVAQMVVETIPEKTNAKTLSCKREWWCEGCNNWSKSITQCSTCMATICENCCQRKS